MLKTRAVGSTVRRVDGWTAVLTVCVGVVLALLTAEGGVRTVAALRVRTAVFETIPAPFTNPSDAVQTSMDAETRADSTAVGAAPRFDPQLSASRTADPFPAAAAFPATANAVADEARFVAAAAALSSVGGLDDEDDADDEDGADVAGADAEPRDMDALADGRDFDMSTHPDSLMQIKTEAELAAKAAKRPRGIGYIALPRVDGTMTRVDYARKLWRERIRRRLRSGGMMRRYAPELFGQDIYGMDENDNVKLGSRATIWDALNGPFAPMPKPSSMRPKPSAAAMKFAMLRDAQRHRKLDDKEMIRHTEYYLKNDPTASAYTYLPKNHRNPFGLSRIFAKARRDQALDIGPWDGPRYTHQFANPTLAFSKGAIRHFPLPSNPRLPWAEADASIAGMRPSKLQQFQDFVPPPTIPKFVPPPNADGSDNTAVGKGDTPE